MIELFRFGWQIGVFSQLDCKQYVFLSKWDMHFIFKQDYDKQIIYIFVVWAYATDLI